MRPQMPPGFLGFPGGFPGMHGAPFGLGHMMAANAYMMGQLGMRPAMPPMGPPPGSLQPPPPDDRGLEDVLGRCDVV